MTGGKQMNLPIRNEAKVKISPTLKHSLWVLAQQQNLSWSECMEMGVQLKLAERGIIDYPNTQMKKKFNKMREAYKELLKEKEILEVPKDDLSDKDKKTNDSREPTGE